MFSSSKNERVRVSKTSTVIVLTTNHGDWTSSKAIFGGNLVCRLVHTHTDTHTTHTPHTTPPRPNTNTNTTHNSHTIHATCTHTTQHTTTHTTPRTRQPTVILRVFFMNARICAHQSTDRDLESVFVKRKVNAWIYARHSTDRDLESVFNVNAWICACQTTDRDLETKKWMLGYVPSASFI